MLNLNGWSLNLASSVQKRSSENAQFSRSTMPRFAGLAQDTVSIRFGAAPFPTPPTSESDSEGENDDLPLTFSLLPNGAMQMVENIPGDPVTHVIANLQQLQAVIPLINVHIEAAAGDPAEAEALTEMLQNALDYFQQ